MCGLPNTAQGLRNDFQDAMEKIDQEYLDDLAKVCLLLTQCVSGVHLGRLRALLDAGRQWQGRGNGP